MNINVARLLLAYTELSADDREELERQIRLYNNAPATKSWGVTRSSKEELRKTAERIVTGPLSSSVCPTCGK